MMLPLPKTRDLVLIGGGHTHALVLRRWAMNPLAGVRVTLIDPSPAAAYSGMLPGFVAGHYTRDDLDIDLVRLAQLADTRFIDGAAADIDLDRHVVTLESGREIAFDVCSMDIGITSDMPRLPGFADNAVPAKPLGPFARAWQAFCGEAPPSPQVCVIGGGVAGGELSLAMAYRLRTLGHTPRITLIDRGTALAALGETARTRMRQHLHDHGVRVIEDATVTALTEKGVVLADDTVLPADFIVGAAGARPHPWQTRLEVTLHDGFVAVSPTLQSSDPALFAVGDCAYMTDDPRPKAGVFAVRQAPVLYDNLVAMLAGGRMRRYRPQRDYLKLISLGQKSALAERFGAAPSGPLLWRWKDRIDRKFMDQFRDLAPMTRPALPRRYAQGLVEALGDKQLCGGCGAKVGRRALADVVAEGGAPGDDAALLTTGGVRQVMSTDHLRAVTADPVRMARIAAQHALGDIWAMGAVPQAATVNIIMPPFSPALQNRSLQEVMRAAKAVFDRAGARIVGGHTSIGAEWTIGFTVTGFCERAPITLDGAREGDALILTKPLGSGVILAAAMAGQARGEDVLRCLAAMEAGQGAASAILRDAHAMTDVTGFGLMGHMANICETSRVGAAIDVADVPLLPGALALAEAGHRSSLFTENVAGAGHGAGSPAGPRAELSYDPQTSGGLLAAVAAEEAEALLVALRRAGYAGAARIGHITNAKEGLVLR